MTPFTSAAILTVGAPTNDGGMRIRLETNELKDEEKIILLKYNNTFGSEVHSANGQANGQDHYFKK